MITISGKYNEAKVMVENIKQLESTVIEQIDYFLGCPALQGCKIRIMPDTHAGMGSVIGFTCTLNDNIIPNIVGVDIGCGVNAYKLNGINDIDFKEFDDHLRKSVPSGFSRRKRESGYLKDYHWKNYIDDLKDDVIGLVEEIQPKSKDVISSLGTLGGGNHYCEIAKDQEGNYWLSLHSGSRNFGLQVCQYYQRKAKELCKEHFSDQTLKMLEFLPMDMGGRDYLNAMYITQKYAEVNRQVMAMHLLEYFGIDVFDLDNGDKISCVHNYIGKDNIIRKGSISAYNGEQVLIPINMRDGTILGRGKGREEWNYSAPHGAGRLMGRNDAKKNLSMEEYKQEMSNVWTSCVSKSTLDEAPMAYKSLDFIMSQVSESVDVEDILVPVYNFKAS